MGFRYSCPHGFHIGERVINIDCSARVSAGTFSSYAVTRICIRGELARRVMNDNVKARCALRNEALAQLCRTCARRTFRDWRF